LGPQGGPKGEKVRSKRVSKYGWCPRWVPRGLFVPLGPFWAHIGAIWVPFGTHFGDFWRVWGFSGFVNPSRAISEFLRFWVLPVGHFLRFFSGRALRGVLLGVFNGFWASLGATGCPKGSLWDPRGEPKGEKVRSKRVSKYGWCPRWAPRAPRGGPGVTFEWIWGWFWGGFRV